jgi:UDP-glucose 4-epimerase
VIRALTALLDQPALTAGEIYNIGSNQEVTINGLAEQVIAQADSASTVRYIPYSEAYAPGFEDMRRRVPDIGKIQQTVGWSPERRLTDILADVIAYERDQIVDPKR